MSESDRERRREIVRTRSAEPHEMDEMGAWSEDSETVWLPRSRFTRAQARTAFAKETGSDWIEVSVLARWARHAPEHPSAEWFDGEYWVECGRDEQGAFQVWRCE